MKEKTGGFLAEFRKFIARGNVMDLAVGVIIGGAFKGITDSLVSDILNPILGIFAGGNDALTGLSISVPGGGAIQLGSFINAVLNFLIMAFVIFCLVKAMNRLYRKKEETPAAPPAPSNEEKLLTEIRDLLKAQKEEN
ncbi:large-conductance mechanosensitive channel protein MscL [Intestinimonas aquisgranensis]|nr:large-conductance mechanosensitive channel protein MscL [Intestinimonas aquisgranensis]